MRILMISNVYFPRINGVSTLIQTFASAYDLVHIQTPFIAHYAGLRLARRLKIPVVESYHTFFEQYVDKYITFLPPSWLRLAARRISAAQCRDWTRSWSRCG